MDYTDRIPDKDASLRNYTFNDFIQNNYLEGIKLVSGGKIFGVEVDVCNLEEVIAALYVMYTYKEYMVQDGPETIVCPKCGELGIMSAYLDMCTSCANKERGLSDV